MRMKLRVAAGLATLLLAGATAEAFAQGGDVIADRRAGLKRMGQHMEAMKPIADAGGDPRAMAARVDEMIVFFRGLPERFPAGSGTGDTKALPAIWTDWAGFQTANTRALGQLEVLKTAAAAGDAAGFATAFKATGPQFCGGCHRPFRAR